MTVENKRKKDKKEEKEKLELARLDEMRKYENVCLENGLSYICGVDEAGRGPLCGPVVAAAVIFPKGVIIEGLNDSKKLTEKKREMLYDQIYEKAIAINYALIYEKEIDEINILQATKKAMKQAIEGLSVKPEYVLIDGNQGIDIDITYKTIVKGDALSISIAAASIIAKVTRDRLIEKLDAKYPEYGFAKHKGYGTKAHIEAIKKYGLCEIHRRTFCKNFVGK